MLIGGKMSIRSLGDLNRHAPWALVERRLLHVGGDGDGHRRPPDRAGVKVGICGEAPSNHPHFTEMLSRTGSSPFP